MARDVVEQVRALCALATSPTTPLDEARNAALLAVRRIQEHDLLGHTREKECKEKPAPLDRVRMRAHFLILNETERYFRFVQLSRESRYKGASKAFTWPRNVVHEYTLMNEEEKRAEFGFAGRVTDTIVLDRGFAEKLEKSGSARWF